jgi:hypothetical protein
MAKVVLDGLNGVAWADDAQVIELSARKGFVEDKQHARIEVLVYLANAAPSIQRLARRPAELRRVLNDAWEAGEL